MKRIFSNPYLLLITCISVLIRVYISFGTGLLWTSTDSINYINQAKALISGGYTYYFPIGYPLIISFFLSLNSFIPLYTSLIVFNIIISTISVVLIYFITKALTGDNNKLAIAAALIAAVYPNQLNYVRFILTEVPAAFFLVLSVFLLVKGKNKISAFSVGYSAVIRTTLLPVPVFYSIYLLYKKQKKEAIEFLLVSLIPLTAFLIYGYLITGEFTLYIDVHKVFSISLGLEEVPTDFGTGLKNYLGYMVSHPFSFLWDRVTSLWDMWGFIPGKTEGLRSQLLFRLLLALRFPLLLLAIYGFIKSKKNTTVVYLILPAVVITTIHAFIITSANEYYIANPRYIFPAEPLLIILAINGIKRIADFISIKKVNNNKE